jgi:hypothetical protein
VAVDDRLGQAGGAGAVEHPERVGERDALELQRRRPVAGEAILPAGPVEIAEPHDARAGQLGGDRVDLRAAVEVPAAVAVAVDGQEDLRLDLREAVDHRARAELGRRRGPDRAERRRGQERRDRLRDVREICGHAIAASHAGGDEPLADPRRLAPQVAPGPGAERTRLGGVAQRDGVVVLAAEDVLGVAERDVREPPRAGHVARGQHGRRVAVGRDAEEVPDRRPEPLDVLDRPAPQLLVGPVLPDVRGEARQRRVRDPLFAGLPEDRGARHGGEASCRGR